MTEASIIIDGIVVVLLLIGAINGYRKGLILTVASFATVLIAIIGAGISAKMFSPVVSEWIQPKVTSFIESKTDDIEAIINDNFNKSSASDSADSVSLFDGLNLSGIDIGGLDFVTNKLGEISDNIKDGLEKADGKLSDFVLENKNLLISVIGKYVSNVIAYVSVSLISFFVINLALYLVIRFMDLASRLPGINTVNKISGLAVGVCTSLLFIFAVSAIISLFNGMITAEILDNTFIFSPILSAGKKIWTLLAGKFPFIEGVIS